MIPKYEYMFGIIDNVGFNRKSNHIFDNAKKQQQKNPAVSSGILCKQFRRLIYDVQSFLLGTVFDFLVFLVALHQDVGERRGQEH